DKPTGDFGLELLAGRQGIMFSPGSVHAQIAITSNINTGILAAERVVSTINSLAKKQPAVETEGERNVVRRLNRINPIRERNKTELRLVLQRPGGNKSVEATFNAIAAETAWSLQQTVFE